MWKIALKLITQYALAKFLRERTHEAQYATGNSDSTSNSEFSKLKKSMAALLESHASSFKAEFNYDIHRVVYSLLGLMFVMFAAICSGLIALMWLFAIAWNSSNRDIILGTTMILPLLIAVGVFFVIRSNWKKRPLLSKSMVKIENDWQVFRNGLDGTADISDEANR